MGRLARVILGASFFSFTCAAVTLTSCPAEAEMDKQEVQSGSATSDVEKGGTAQPESPSEEITERGIQPLVPRTGMGMTTPPGTMAPQDTGFKCSPRSGRCNCSGKTDCDYMKDLINTSCGKFTCTGSGNSQKCTCTINGY